MTNTLEMSSIPAEPSMEATLRLNMISNPKIGSGSGELILTLRVASPSVSLTSTSVSTNPTTTTVK